MALEVAATPAPFIWGDGGAQLTPEQIAAQRKVAQALMEKGMDYSPVQSWTQGGARVAQALMGAYDDSQLDTKAKEQNKATIAAYMGAPGLSDTPPPAAPAAGLSSVADPAVSDAIAKVAAARGVDPQYLTRTAMLESGGKTDAASPLSSARGPFQFIKSTAAQYGLTNPSDPEASTDAAARLTLDNKAALTKALGREPTNGELYLAHQQGAGGASALLANPDASVESIIGADAARNNGANPGMTAGQFAQKWTSKFSPSADPAAIPVNAKPAGPAGIDVAAQPAYPQTQAPSAVQTVAQAMQPQAQQPAPTNTIPMRNPVEIPPAMRTYIKGLIANPNTRDAGWKMYQEYAKPKDPEYTPIGDNAILNKKTGQITQVDANKKTSEIRNYDAYVAQEKAAGREPMSLMDHEIKMKQAGAMANNVTLNADKTGAEHLASKAVEGYDNAMLASRESQKRIALYDTLDKAAQGFTPGATAEMRLTAKRYLKDSGLIAGTDVPDGEIMQMISRSLAIHAQPKGQGAVSNYERELYANSLPNMSQSPEGLKTAIGINRKLEQFDQQVAQIYRDSARQSPHGIPNYLQVQDKIAGLGSPLDDKDMMELKKAAPSSVPTQAGAAPSGKTKSGVTWSVK